MTDQSTTLYDEEYYRTYFSIGGGELVYERNDHWNGFFGGVAASIIDKIAPETVLDAGCALGMLVEHLRLRGVDAKGFDVSEYGISQMPDAMADHVWVGSLTEPIEGRYDLITCIEVLEHIPASETDEAIRNLTAATDALLVSTTPGDHAEATHFNVRPPEFWSERLAEQGFFRDLDFDANFLTPWAGLYRRSDRSPAEVARDYERERWRLIVERDDLRQDVLRREDATEAVAEADETTARLQAEVADLRRQLLLARDAAQGAEAAKATAEARRVELEHALGVARAREEETGELVAKLYDVADGDLHRLEVLVDARSYRVFLRLLRPYRWLRNR